MWMYLFCQNLFGIYRLTADDVNEDSVVPLSYVKFQNVQQLTVSPLQYLIFAHTMQLIFLSSYVFSAFPTTH